jgi:pimeloyl-[acyl-carrier protein] synthase
MTVERVLRTATEVARVLGAVSLEWLRTRMVFNPVAKRHREDPYPFYHRVRAGDPIHRSWAAYGWVLSRHRDVVEVLRDPRFSADDRNFSQYGKIRAQRVRDGLADPDEEPAPVMLRIDPPDHTRLRSLVSKAFTPRAVARLRARIEEITAELLDGVAGRDGFDVIAELAIPLPVTIIAEMLGIPAEDRATFKRWSDVLVGFLDPQAARDPAVMRTTVEEFFAYVGRIAAERRARPADDLLSALVAAEDAGQKLSEEELHGTVALLLAAGNETTTNLIGNGLLALLRHPAELARLRADPALIERAVEELLRYDSPVQLTGRIAKEDVDFHGTRFRKGQNVILLLGAANRDPEVFAEPDRLDLTRADVDHLSFGHGHHFCLGAQLARLEAQIALGELVRRFPQLRLADGALEWGRFSFLRGPKALRVLV